MKIAIVQSSYVPWKGKLDLIHSVDEFVLFDDVQFTRRDWRNRNLIKTPGGTAWLTIPVNNKGNYRAPSKTFPSAIPRGAPDTGRCSRPITRGRISADTQGF
jgi:hypothetical protein